MNRKEIVLHPEIVYIPKEVKKKLKETTRKQKYYFVIDYSDGNENNINDYIKRVKDYIHDNHIEEDVAEISAVNSNEKRLAYDKEWEKELKYTDVEGGFFLEYTIKRIFYENYTKDVNERPVILVVTNNINKAVGLNNIGDFRFACPEGVYYYHLDKDEKLKRYSDFENSGEYVDKIDKVPVLTWKSEKDRTFYLSKQEEDSIVIQDDQLEITMENFRNSKWENGILLNGMYMSYMLHPEKQNEKSLSIVKNSIRANVMSPLTSFIVLENEAQEKVMIEKQKKILSTKKPIHIGDMTEMDEPSLCVILLIIIIFLIGRQSLIILKK